MRGYSFRFVTLCALLALGAGAQYSLHGRRVSSPRLPDWSKLPRQIGQWRDEEVPVDADIAAHLQAEALLSRCYRRAGAKLCFSAVYGTRWRALHSPVGCYLSQGWRVVRREEIAIPLAHPLPHPGPLHAEEILAQRGGAYLLVTYLYAYPGGTTASWVAQCLRVAQGSPAAGGVLMMVEALCQPRSLSWVAQAERELLAGLYPFVVEMWYG
jgi:EpsI family protein